MHHLAIYSGPEFQVKRNLFQKELYIVESTVQSQMNIFYLTFSSRKFLQKNGQKFWKSLVVFCYSRRPIICQTDKGILENLLHHKHSAVRPNRSSVTLKEDFLLKKAGN